MVMSGRFLKKQSCLSMFTSEDADARGMRLSARL